MDLRQPLCASVYHLEQRAREYHTDQLKQGEKQRFSNTDLLPIFRLKINRAHHEDGKCDTSSAKSCSVFLHEILGRIDATPGVGVVLVDRIGVSIADHRLKRQQ